MQLSPFLLTSATHSIKGAGTISGMNALHISYECTAITYGLDREVTGEHNILIFYLEGLDH